MQISAMKRWTLMLLVAAIALPLMACGKKGPPDPPPGEPNTYPMHYPHD